jgi:hypothetical protein
VDESKSSIWNRKGAKDNKENKNCNANDVRPQCEYRRRSNALNAFAFFVFFAVQLHFLG